MVHQRSEAALQRRHERAAHLGFLVSRPPGTRWLLVDEALYQPLRDIQTSLRLHMKADSLTGRPHHYARQSAAAAFSSGYFTNQELNSACRTHRHANRLKHSARLWKASDVHEKFKQKVLSQKASEGVDVFQANDPWQGAKFPHITATPDINDPWMNYTPITSCGGACPCSIPGQPPAPTSAADTQKERRCYEVVVLTHKELVSVAAKRVVSSIFARASDHACTRSSLRAAQKWHRLGHEVLECERGNAFLLAGLTGLLRQQKSLADDLRQTSCQFQRSSSAVSG